MSLTSHLGYIALALLVGCESSGVPVPGETALIASGVLAQRGELNIELVIAIAATAAIIGDNVGYVIGRHVGRRLFTRPGWFHDHRLRALDHGERLFDRHGPRAVFFGRWLLGLRVWASWLAGMTHMPWRSFLLWNALGGISWAITVGLGGYLLGEAAEQLFATVGVAATIVVIVAAIGLVIAFHVRRRRREAREGPPTAEPVAQTDLDGA